MRYKPCFNGYIQEVEVIKPYHRNIKSGLSFLYNVIGRREI